MTDSSNIVKIVSWNIARRAECWEHLIDMGADVALLQEAAEPPTEFADRIDVDPARWRTAGGDWRSTACMARGCREALESRIGGVDRGQSPFPTQDPENSQSAVWVRSLPRT